MSVFKFPLLGCDFENLSPQETSLPFSPEHKLICVTPEPVFPRHLRALHGVVGQSPNGTAEQASVPGNSVLLLLELGPGSHNEDMS